MCKRNKPIKGKLGAPYKFVLGAVILLGNVVAPANASESVMSYDWVSVAYMEQEDSDEFEDVKGFGLSMSITPFKDNDTIFMTLSLEDLSADAFPKYGDINADGQAIVATVGRYWPLSDNVNFNLSIGADYESVKVKGHGVELKSSDWYASIEAGVSIAVGKRWLLDLTAQTLQGGADDGSVLRFSSAFELANNFDLFVCTSYEDSRFSHLLGLRKRF